MICRNFEKLGKELRKTKIELELAERQLRKLTEKGRLVENSKSTRYHPTENLSVNIDAVPVKRKAALITIPQSIGHIMPEEPSTLTIPRASTLVTPRAISRATNIVIPPKFAPTRLHSTVADGCGGTKKVIHFPDQRP
jgi:hypothetical protein